MVLTELSDVLQVPLVPALSAALNDFADGIIEYRVSDNKEQTTAWWNLRKYISDAQKIDGVSIKHDVSVAISNVAEFIARSDAALAQAFPGIRIVAFGHIGDGNIHYNASMPGTAENIKLFQQSAAVNRIVYDIIAQLNGSISAEHGVGQLKREEMQHSKSLLELELMRRIKQALDPQQMMNPGKVL
jgi:FAD/FMN-containing dehydrogenase